MPDSMADKQTETENLNEELTKDSLESADLSSDTSSVPADDVNGDSQPDDVAVSNTTAKGDFAGGWDALAKMTVQGWDPNLLSSAAASVKESVFFKAFGTPKQAAESLLAMRPTGEKASTMLSLVALLVAALSLINDVLPDQTALGQAITISGIILLIAIIAGYLFYSYFEASRNSALTTVLTYIKCNPDENPILDNSAKAIKLPNNKKLICLGAVVTSAGTVAIIAAMVVTTLCTTLSAKDNDEEPEQQDLNSVYASLSVQGIETRAQLDAVSRMLEEKVSQTPDNEKGDLQARIGDVKGASDAIGEALGKDHSSPNLASALGGLAKSILGGKIKLADSLIDLGGITPTLSVDLGDQVKEYLSNISTELTNISNNTDSLSASFDSTEINKIVEELTQIENKYNIDLSSVKNSIKQIHNSSSSTTIINNSFNGGRDACACNPQNDSDCGCG